MPKYIFTIRFWRNVLLFGWKYAKSTENLLEALEDMMMLIIESEKEWPGWLFAAEAAMEDREND